MVRIEEMTDILKVVKVGLKEKQWVRLRQGLYKRDLAQVDYVEHSENKVNLKLIPRIDYNRLRERASSSDNVSLFISAILPEVRSFYVSYTVSQLVALFITT